MDKRKILKFLAAVLIWDMSTGDIRANGFGLPDQDAFATARGEAFVATADNPSAIFYNPAGIAWMDGDNFRGGLYGIYLDPSYRPPAGASNSGNTYHESQNYAFIPQFFYAHSMENLPFSFGLGIYAPYGGKTSWPQDTGFRSVAIRGSLKYITINPVVAWDISPALAIGAGAMVNYVQLEMFQGLQATQTPFSTNFFDFAGSGWSLGGNVGVLWQPREKISIGANFRSAAKVTLDGRTHFERQPTIPDSHRPANMDLNFPWTAVAGISYRPVPHWNLEVDANYTAWNTFGTSHLHESSPPPPLKTDVPVHFSWQGSWMYEFGVTRYFDNGWHVSGGYAFNQNSVPNHYYTPLAADMDRHFFSLGAGFFGKTLDLDVAGQFGIGQDQTVTGSTPSSTPGQFSNQSADGKYGFVSVAVMLTAGLHF